MAADPIPNTDETVYSGFGEEMTGSGFDLLYPSNGDEQPAGKKK